MLLTVRREIIRANLPRRLVYACLSSVKSSLSDLAEQTSSWVRLVGFLRDWEHTRSQRPSGPTLMTFDVLNGWDC